MTRQSIRPTYDSRKTGYPYHVTYEINDYALKFQEPISDPFVRARVVVGWRDLVKALLHRRQLEVVVRIGGNPDVVDDVLELDANTLIPDSTRRAAWDSHVSERLDALARAHEDGGAGDE